MLSDADALLEAIVANPDEDTPRLVYADWLDEQAGKQTCSECKGKGLVYATVNPGCDNEYDVEDGCRSCCGAGRVSDGRRERAEFIRVQVAMSQRPACLESGHSCDYCHRLRKRERFWIERNRGQLQAQLPAPFVVGLARQEQDTSPCALFSRGAVSEVRLSAAAFLGGACERCRRRQGNVRDDLVGLYDCPDCRGTGRTEGLAARLFKDHPITTVRLPGVVRGDTIFRGHGDGDLSAEVWQQLGLLRCEDEEHFGAGTHLHITEDEFSALLVAYGRDLCRRSSVPS